MHRIRWLAAVSTFADVATPLILPWYGYDLSHSLAIMATMFVAEALVPLMTGWGLSSYISHAEAGELFRVGQGTRAVTFLALVSIPFGKDSWPIEMALIIAAGLNGFGSVMAESAMQTALPGQGPQLIEHANRLQRVVMIVRVVGAPMGGLLMGSLGPVVTLSVLSDLSAVSGILGPLWLPRTHFRSILDGDKRSRNRGFDQLWRIPVLRSLAIQAMIGNFGWTLVMSGFLYYLLNRLHLSSPAVSGVYLCVTVGSVAGTGVVLPLLSRFRRGQLYPAFLSGGLLGLLILQWLTAWAAAIGEALVGLCDTAWVVLSVGLRLELLRPEERSSVLTASRLLSNMLIPVGGGIVAFWGIHWGFAVLFGMAAVIKAIEVVIAKMTDIGRIDKESCCAIMGMRRSVSSPSP
ncbi:hypothetical protein SAMN00768000_3756 [Sulfobacillus thermosulfidooxidans DSM 9293]|uniref:MFS transporter n=1 Tax=Sulfobacillus thermosulfidooxidans (strain DSM 9293 / VKM B-1269 / AT-1) TaxID=929705 RepID=A0A1W1WPG5_SULTA|nr:MFS transporter [Sulfobacillus thermosulfidooxidans]SMC08214.1 hypothetical protein SAMN00768000_3756 [Sulfobacillus thermosulfidooxidans DSM 9293]